RAVSTSTGSAKRRPPPAPVSGSGRAASSQTLPGRWRGEERGGVGAVGRWGRRSARARLPFLRPYSPALLQPAVAAEGSRAAGAVAGEVVEGGAEDGAEVARAEALDDVAAAGAVAEHGVGPLDVLDALADDPHVPRPEVLGVEGAEEAGVEPVRRRLHVVLRVELAELEEAFEGAVDVAGEEVVLAVGEGEAGVGAGVAEVFEGGRSEEHTSELQSRENLVCRLLLEKKNSRTT